MNTLGNFAIEQAEQRVEQERDASIARARSGLKVTGAPAVHCRACGAEIPEARRRALPSARHCIDCAETRERLGKR